MLLSSFLIPLLSCPFPESISCCLFRASVIVVFLLYKFAPLPSLSSLFFHSHRGVLPVPFPSTPSTSDWLSSLCPFPDRGWLSARARPSPPLDRTAWGASLTEWFLGVSYFLFLPQAFTKPLSGRKWPSYLCLKSDIFLSFL